MNDLGDILWILSTDHRNKQQILTNCHGKILRILTNGPREKNANFVKQSWNKNVINFMKRSWEKWKISSNGHGKNHEI